MKIKNIRQFRGIIKNEIADLNYNDRNENFIGVSVAKEGTGFEYGFFSIYHGLKKGYNGNDGVRGFLKGFLDMASDGQAVYEFMQNAVDARSSKFCLFWDKDEDDGEEYLLVVNNGTMFDADGIQSILNIGISTKASDSYSIGKFGIGFKLAHRLVGKENGLDELIDKNYGPVLFSWKNAELATIASLTEKDEVEPLDFKYEVVIEENEKRLSINSEEPWLFKILITNFPCQPENNIVPEVIQDYKYVTTNNAFSKKEFATLSKWVNKYSSYFKEGFDNGSLFFIKLGQGKKTHLEATNLEEGVRFSLAILNRIAFKSLGHPGLKDIILRGVHLNPVELEFESFTIEKGSADFRFIRFGKTNDLSDLEIATENTDANIEILIGYTDYKTAYEAFKNAPNFYLFFPLSEEKHNIRFIIHSNAFYKGTARTHLQKGNSNEEGINERLLSVFARLLNQKMIEWASSSNEKEKSNFLQLYANLLLSNASDNPERVWVNAPLWAPILDFLQTNIPVKNIESNSFNLSDQVDKIRIKNTVLPVDSEMWLQDVTKWFVWDSSDIELSTEAESKLKIKRFNIIDLLQIKDISGKLNQWLDSTNYSLIDDILNELNSQSLLTVKDDFFWNNLGALKIWEFEDDFFSIEEIGYETEYSNRLILFDTLDAIKEQLIRGGWKLSKKSLSEYVNLWTPVQNRFQAVIKYIRRNEELIRVLNLKLPAANLSPSERINIVKVLAKKLSDEKEERISKLREIQLFRNQLGQITPLKSLLKAANIGWLSSWVIHSEDYDTSLDDYFIVNPPDIYQNIVLAFWSVIVNRLTSEAAIRSLFDYAKGVYAQNPKLNVLSDKEIVRVGSTFVSQTSPFYYSHSLTSFSETEYSFLDTVLQKLNSPSLPAYDLLKYYEEPPFKIISKPFNYTLSFDISVNLEEAKAFLKLCNKENPEIFKSLSISQAADSEITIAPRLEGFHMIVSDNSLVRNYITTYHSELFLILPEALKEFGGAITLRDKELINRLSFECDLNNEKQLIELIEISLQSEVESRKYLANKIPSVFFDMDKPLTTELVSVRFIKLLLSIDDGTTYSENIKPKTSIKFDNELVQLSEVHLLGSDVVSFEIGEDTHSLSLSSILINTDTKATKMVGQLTDLLSNLGIAEKSVLDILFGLSGQVDKSIIAAQLKEKYAEQTLDNCHQLAFVLHYSKLKPTCYSTEFFSIDTKIGSSQLKDIVFYPSENMQDYIPQGLVLHNKYEGVFKLLSLYTSLYRGSSGVIVCKCPYFDGNKVHLPGISKIDGGDNQLLFIEYLFCNWKKERDQLSNIYLGDSKKWLEIIGFEPALTIAGSLLVVDSEKLPFFVQNWLDISHLEINSNEKSEFLKALGVSLRGSDVIRLRKYLVGEESIIPTINYNLPEALVYNSLVLLESRECQFIIGSSQMELLKEFYNRLPENIDLKEVPLPLISSKGLYTIILSKAAEAVYIEVATVSQFAEISYSLSKLPADAGKPIIYSSLFRDLTKLKKQFNPLEIEFDVLDVSSIENGGIEWNRNFYTQWKVINPGYKIICYPGNIPYLLNISGVAVFSYNKSEIVFQNNTIIANNEKNDKSIIALIEAKQYLPANVLQQLKELFSKYDDSIQDFLNRIQLNPKYKEDFEKLQQKRNIDQKKKELSEGFGNSIPYTMKWFMNLLELMVLSAGGKDLANPEGNINFHKIKYDPLDLRLITFSNPSKSLSPSIDLFTNFKATFHYIDENELKRSKQIKINGLSRKGHEVVAIPTNSSDLDTINLPGVIEVELTFVRILDLISKLTNAFESLALEDNYNLKAELTENINFIFGPPGTGKTTEIAKQVINKIETGSSKNILILTPTNKAADVIVKRILELTGNEAYTENWLCRYGASTDLDLLDRGMTYDGNSFKFHLFEKCVMVTTIQRFPYEKVITNEDENGEDKTSISDIAWDTIIFDEASMIMLPAIVYPLFKRKYKRYDEQELTEFIIGGDPLQIPPIYDIADSDLGEDNEDVKEENIYTMVGLKSFDDKIQATIPNYGNKIKNLPIQYRSIEAIGSIFSKFQYNGDLDHGRKYNLGGPPNPRPLPAYFIKLGFKPITIIRYPVNSSDAIFNPQKLNGSPFHLYSSFLVNELIIKFRDEATENWDIGVIAPYRSQATLLNKLIESHADKSKLNIITDTVHGFQGGECDLVFNVFNPSSTRSQYSYFLKKEFIINVAISRARDYLIILLPDEDTEGLSSLDLFHQSHSNSLLSIIKELPGDSVAYLEASDIEKKIMGKSDFFQKNSLTQVHNDVNIFSDLYKDYHIVKVNGKALDIHLKRQ